MTRLPEKLDELLDYNFRSLERHHTEICCAIMVTGTAAGIALSVALRLNAGEYLGLAFLGPLLVLPFQRLYGRYARRDEARQQAEWVAYCRRVQR
jgi:hypothetical protein